MFESDQVLSGADLHKQHSSFSATEQLITTVFSNFLVLW